MLLLLDIDVLMSSCPFNSPSVPLAVRKTLRIVFLTHVSSFQKFLLCHAGSKQKWYSIRFPFCLTQSGHLQEVCANAYNCIPFYGRLHRKVAMHLSILELNYVCSKHRKSEQELGALCFCTPNQISSDVCWSCFQAVLCTCHTPTAGGCLKYIVEWFLAQFPYWEVEKNSVFICLSCSTENMREIDTCLQFPILLRSRNQINKNLKFWYVEYL